MEAAQSTVKKLLNNESGNIIVVVGLIGMIAGGVFFWNNLAGKVDNEVRSLGTTQSTTYMRADFRTSIKKSLQGTNTECPSTVLSTLESKFKNYTTSATNATYSINYTDNPSTPANEVETNANIKCFFHPARYMGLNWESLKVSIIRTTEPNYMTLSNFVAADVQAVFRVSGKPTVLKYQLRYRVDVLSLNHFGVIFMNSDSGPLFDLGPTTKVQLRSNVLFDTANRSGHFPVTNLMLLPDFERLTYLKETYTSVRDFVSNTETLKFLDIHTLGEVFKKGIDYGLLPSDSGFQAPYQRSPDQWNELLDMGPTITTGFALPNTTPPSAIWNEMTSTASATYSGPNTDTKDIYSRILPAQGAKGVIHTCRPVDDVTSGPYNIFVFNNLNQDLTIDFTENIDLAAPPVFCGVVAVKDLIVKLNDQGETSPVFQHHLLGKIIVRGKIRVIGNGHLNIHDIMDFTESDIDYVMAAPLNISNLRTQYFNQKYYATQNFFLPYFKSGQNLTVGASSLMSDDNRYYVPRSTTAFFQGNCSPAATNKCREANIGSPEKEHLAQNHWQKLMFEVFNVE